MHKKKDGSFVDKRSNDINVSFSIFISLCMLVLACLLHLEFIEYCGIGGA